MGFNSAFKGLNRLFLKITLNDEKDGVMIIKPGRLVIGNI